MQGAYRAELPQVWFRFRIDSDFAVTAAGAVLDDFQVWVSCIDTDSDGTDDCNDGCINDPGKIDPGTKEAIRALKRRLSDVVYRHLVADTHQQH